MVILIMRRCQLKMSGCLLGSTVASKSQEHTAETINLVSMLKKGFASIN